MSAGRALALFSCIYTLRSTDDGLHDEQEVQLLLLRLGICKQRGIAGTRGQIQCDHASDVRMQQISNGRLQTAVRVAIRHPTWLSECLILSSELTC